MPKDNPFVRPALVGIAHLDVYNVNCLITGGEKLIQSNKQKHGQVSELLHFYRVMTTKYWGYIYT